MAVNGNNREVLPALAADAVLKASAPISDGAREVQGVEFNHYGGRDITVKEIIAGMARMGFQASAVSEAVRIIKDMVGILSAHTSPTC